MFRCFHETALGKKNQSGIEYSNSLSLLTLTLKAGLGGSWIDKTSLI